METESSEPAPAASGAAAPSPDDVPLPKRMRTQSQKLSELDDLDLGPVPAVEAATVQAEAPSDGAPPTLDTAPRGTEGTEMERMGSGELSSKSDHVKSGNATSRASRRATDAEPSAPGASHQHSTIESRHPFRVSTRLCPPLAWY